MLLVLASADLMLARANTYPVGALASGVYRANNMKSSVRIATCCAILATAMVSGLTADIRQSSYQLPSDALVIGYLFQSVNWYRHVYTERQVAGDPGDLVFLNDNQAIESQIVMLSFEFAKADAALAKTASSAHHPATTSAAPSSEDLAHFVELKNRNDQVTQQTSADIGKLNEKIASAHKADRKKLKAALDDGSYRLPGRRKPTLQLSI
jgi:hypothetical protein